MNIHLKYFGSIVTIFLFGFLYLLVDEQIKRNKKTECSTVPKMAVKMDVMFQSGKVMEKTFHVPISAKFAINGSDGIYHLEVFCDCYMSNNSRSEIMGYGIKNFLIKEN